jgi:putative membrane protein
MGFGFVVSKFGLFLRLLLVQHSTSLISGPAPRHFSTIVGVVLVVLGSGILVFAALQHRAFIRGLPPHDVPPNHRPFFPVIVAMALGIVGLALALYLVV